MSAAGEVGILHPGLMGETLAANCLAPTLWVPDGRSAQTRARAVVHGMADVASLHELAERAAVVVSICPPDAALEQANQVAQAGFDGLYVDANAVSPDTARAIAALFEHYVDGSVIGPPANKAGTTRLYLSGERAAEISALYKGSLLDARVIGTDAAAASALKMAYASWTKIGAALQLAIRSLAKTEGVDQALVDEWHLSQPGMVERSQAVAAGVAPKAWRFAGEMDQIAESFSAAGLPSGFADAASDIYQHLAGFKGSTGVELDQVLAALQVESRRD